MASPGAVTVQDNADSPQKSASENLFASRLITGLSSQQTTKKVANGDGQGGELYFKMVH